MMHPRLWRQWRRTQTDLVGRTASCRLTVSWKQLPLTKTSNHTVCPRTHWHLDAFNIKPTWFLMRSITELWCKGLGFHRGLTFRYWSTKGQGSKSNWCSRKIWKMKLNKKNPIHLIWGHLFSPPKSWLPLIKRGLVSVSLMDWWTSLLLGK
jgi:hypothetical protein